MQEEFIRNLTETMSPDLEDKILGLHPSSNHVFREDGKLEKTAEIVTGIVKSPFLLGDKYLGEKQRQFSLEDKTKLWALNGAGRIFTYGIPLVVDLATVAGYNIIEATSRIVESGIRGTKRGIGYLAKKVYDHFDQDETSWFKRGWNSVKERYNTVANETSSWYQGLSDNKQKQLEKYGLGTWNHLVSVGSVTLGAIVLLGMCSGEPEKRVEERVIIEEPTRSIEIFNAFTDGFQEILRREEERNRPRPVPRPSVTPERTTTQRRVETRPVQRQPQQIPLDQLSNFGHQSVLAYCSDQVHVNYVMETLRVQARAARRLDSGFRMTTSEGNGITTIRFGDTTIKVVKNGQTIPQVRGGYDVITLRGHVWDMSRLYNDASAFEASNTYYIVGGCRSDGQIVAHASADKAMSAGTESENGVNNTDFLVEYLRFKNPSFCSSGNTGERCRNFVDRNSRQGRNTWEGYRSYMHNVAPINSRRWVFPGSTAYVRR
jgi:hypothetical protein